MSFSPSLWRNDSKRYGNISRLLHWLIAIFIFTMLGLGWAMDIIPKEWKPTAMGNTQIARHPYSGARHHTLMLAFL